MTSDKNMRVEEDQNKVLAPILHYKRMLEEIFDSADKDSKFKRQIPLSFSVLSDTQSIHGGITGWISFDFVVLEVLWIEKNFRKKGLGRVLLEKLEDAAIKNQCSRIFTSTNSYSDSLGFWLKNGFELLHTVESSESKISVFYLQKILHPKLSGKEESAG